MNTITFENVPKYLENGDPIPFLSFLEDFLHKNHLPGEAPVSKEEWRSHLMLILNMAGMKPSALGNTACVVTTYRYVYIIATDTDGSADDALDRIEENQKTQEYLSGTRKTYMISINFSSEKVNVHD